MLFYIILIRILYTILYRQTAYNHFVHQEKQFVACTNITNMKHKTGRYCSVRWKSMTPEEKNLYLILEQTGSKN